MSFRIQTQSPQLKRELEKQLAALESQLDGDFDYEISAEVLPAERALDGAASLAESTGADAVFIAAGAFAEKEAVAEIPVAPRREEPAPLIEQVRREVPVAPQAAAGEPRPPRIDTQKLKQTFAKRSADAREWSAGAGSRIHSWMQLAGSYTAGALDRSGEWVSQKSGEAKIAGGALRRRLAQTIEQSRQSAAEWNARRVERQAAEAKLRAERGRAAHREAELAAAAAKIMQQQQQREDERKRAALLKERVSKPPVALVSNESPKTERDSWPIWRNAFAAAAALALLGVFLLAAGSKQTKASPATSTELARPAVVVPEHFARRPKPAAPVISTVSPSIVTAPSKAANLSPRKRVAPSTDNEDSQEVTVRHYPSAATVANPKKDAKGVVQISDME